VEQDEEVDFFFGGVTQVEDVAIGAPAADDRAPGRSVEALTVQAHGDFAVVADAHAGLLTPDIRPPRAGGHRTQDGALGVQGLLASVLGREAQFTVGFVLVDMGQQLIEQVIGPLEFEDTVGG
jgi:hypothetical protein